MNEIVKANNKLPSEIQKVITESKVTDMTKAEKLASGYAPFLMEISEQMQKFKKLEKGKAEDVETAKRIRLDLGKICSRAEERKKADKGMLLIETRLIDNLFGLVNNSARLTQAEAKEIEKYFENIEKEKIAKLQEERASEMGKYQDELDYIPDNLGSMPENIWANYLVGVKHSYEVQKEAEVKAEKERIEKEKAEIAEQKRIKAENIKLQKEAEERERLAKIEKEKRDKIEAERIKKEDAEKLAREKETKRLQDAANTILKKEREEREKIQAELEVKKLEEERVKSERLANLEAELNKGDSDKVKDLISDLNSLKTKYSFKSVKNKKVYKDVALLIDKVVEHIHKA